jgi:hypothetical protein
MLMKMNCDADRVRTMAKMTLAIAEAAATYAGNNSNKIVLENEVLLAVGVK